MSVGIIRGLITLVLLSTFLGLIVWLVMHGKQDVFREAAHRPLEDDDVSPGSRRS